MSTYGAMAYQRAQTTLGPRQLEAHLLLKAAAQLNERKEGWTGLADAIEALTFNRKLWTILGTSATAEESPLPAELRQNIGNLTVFVLKRTLEIMEEPSADKLAALIDINRMLAEGLRD